MIDFGAEEMYNKNMCYRIQQITFLYYRSARHKYYAIKYNTFMYDIHLLSSYVITTRKLLLQ